MSLFALVGVRFQAQGVGTFLSKVTVARNAIRGINAATSKANAGKLSRNINSVGSSSQKAQRHIVALNDRIVSLGRSLARTGRYALTAGTSLSFLATVPILAGLGQASKAAIDFETEIVKLNTLAGISVQAMGELEEGILKIAPAIGISANELSEAAFFVVSGGVRDTAQALSVLEASGKAAALGLGETKAIANAVTSVMNAYGHETTDAAATVDTLVAAVQRGKFEVSQLAPVIGKALGLSSDLGVSFAEASNFIATYTLSGATASEATNSLVRVLATVAKPSKQAAEALAEVTGAASGDEAIENLRAAIADQGLTATLIEMRKQFDAAGVDIAQFFTRITGLRGVLFNTGEASAFFAQNLAIINEAAGITEEGFERVATTTRFQLDAMKAQINVLAITIGRVLLPHINALIDKLKPFVVAAVEFANANPKIVQTAVAIALAVAALGPLLIVIGFTLTAIGNLVSLLGPLIGAFLKLGGIVTLVTNPVGFLAKALLVLAGILGVTLIASVDDAGRALNDKLGGDMTALANRAHAWGRNIFLQLARGMIVGLTYVVQAINMLGQLITAWLAPGSPPKILPDLPEWGSAAMQEFVNGFTQADFSTFGEITRVIESIFERLGEEANVDVIGFREAVASSINQVKSLTSTTDPLIDRIADGFARAGTSANRFISTMLRLSVAQANVARVQQEIADINTNYDNAVAPLNARLREIEGIRKQFETSNRIEELNAIIADPFATEDAKYLAQLELEEIQIQSQIGIEEGKRDAALTVAEARLEAAQAELDVLQERADLLRSMIQEQNNFGQIIQDTINGLDEVTGKIGDAASSLGDVADELEGLDVGGAGGALDDALGGIGDALGGGGIGGIDDELLDGIPTLEEMFGDDLLKNLPDEGIFAGITESIGSLFSELETEIGGLTTAWSEAQATWGNLMAEFVLWWDTNVIQRWGDFTTQVNTFFSNSEFTGWLDRLAERWDFFVFGLTQGGLDGVSALERLRNGGLFLLGVFNRLWQGIKNIWPSIMELVLNIVDIILGAFQVFIGVITGDWATIVTGLMQIARGILTGAWNVIKGIFFGILGLWGVTKEEAIQRLQDMWNQMQIIWRLWRVKFLVWKNNLETKWQEMWQNLKDWFSETWETIDTAWREGWQAIGGTVQDAWGDIRLKFKVGWRDFKEAYQERVDRLKEGWETLWTETIPGAIDTAKTALRTAADNTLAAIGDAVKAIDFVAFGLAIVGGIASGITRGASMIGAAIVGAVLSGKKAGETAAETNSPSKLYAELGDNIAAGITMGFQNRISAFSELVAATVSAGATVGAGETTIPAGMQMAGGGGPVAQFGDTHINNGMDLRAFESRINQVIDRRIGTRT
jgi:TP901 family phage tail tape measure protein